MQGACAVCGNKNPPEWRFVNGWVADSGLVRVQCPLGHDSAVIYDERKYMLLLQSACLAFLGGHYRESVSSIAAGLERSYEFYIRVTCQCRGLDPGDVNRTWKALSRQSERQFGAFLFLWLLDGNSAFTLPSQVPEFRNKVLHQGYIPTKEEVLGYGNDVFGLVSQVSRALDNLDQSKLLEVQKAYLDAQRSEIPEGMQFLTLKATAVQVDGSEVVRVAETFEDYLGAMARRVGAQCAS